MYLCEELRNELESNGFEATYKRLVVDEGKPSDGLTSNGRKIIEYAIENNLDFDYKYIVFNYSWHLSNELINKTKLSKAVAEVTKQGQKVSLQCLLDQGDLAVLVDALNKNDCINDGNTYCRTSLFSFFCDMITGKDTQYIISELRAIKKKKHKRILGYIVFHGMATSGHIDKYESVINKSLIDDFVCLLREWDLLNEFWDRFFKKTGISLLSHINSDLVEYLPDSRKVQDIATDAFSASIEELIKMSDKGLVSPEIAAQDMLLKCIYRSHYEISFSAEAYKYLEFCIKNNIFMPYTVIRIFVHPHKNGGSDHYQEIFDRVGLDLYKKWVLEDLSATSIEMAVKEYGEAIIAQELDEGVFVGRKFQPLDVLLDNLNEDELKDLFQSSSQASIVGAKRTDNPMEFSPFVKSPRARTLLSKMILSA